jgi:ketosteroid isomerase-like protein
MDSLITSGGVTPGQVDSPNLRFIRQAFDVSVERGFVAGLEELLANAAEDCEFRPYISSGEPISGHDAIRAFYRSAIKAGTEMRLRPTAFREEDDMVIVNGTMRVGRPSGGFAESQLSWTYKFRDGLLAEVAWRPRRAG